MGFLSPCLEFHHSEQHAGYQACELQSKLLVSPLVMENQMETAIYIYIYTYIYIGLCRGL